MRKTKAIKLTVIIAMSLVAALFSFFVDFRQFDVMFVSLFYIPMILAGIWFHRKIIPLTLAFVVILFIFDITMPGHGPKPELIRTDQIIRGGILVAGAFLFYFMGRALDRKSRELEENRQQLAGEKERLRITLLSINDGVVSTDGNGNIRLMNDVARKLSGWQDDALGRPFAEVFRLVDEYTGEACRDMAAEALGGKPAGDSANEVLLVSREGRETPVTVSAAPIRLEKALGTGAVLIIRDVTAIKRSQRDLEYQSLHDQLTGLGNRRMMDVQIKRLIREQTLPVAVIVGDVNGLKLVNDAMGHAMGDTLLMRAAETLRGAVREDDAVFRYGGDEFVILLPGADEAGAEQIIARVHRAFSEITVGPVRLSISLGCCVKADGEADIIDVMRRAEDRMYARKLIESIDTKKGIIAGMIAMSPIHGAHTAELCALAIEAFGIRGRDAKDLKTACMVRDIGRVAMDQSGAHEDAMRPARDETAAEKRHAEISYRILNMVPGYAGIAEYVLAHHERWDGAGYPRGLKGEEIPQLSRIIAIVDYVDLLPEENVASETAVRLMSHAGKRFDPELTRAFADKLSRYAVGAPIYSGRPARLQRGTATGS